MKIMKVSKIFMASVLLIFGVVVKADYAEYKNDFIAAGKATFNEKDQFIAGRCFTEKEPAVMKSGVLLLVHDGDGVKMVIPAYSINTDLTYWDEYGDYQRDLIRDYSFLSVNQVGQFDGDNFISVLNYEYYPVGNLTLKQATDGGYWLKMSALPDMSEQKDYFYCHFYKTIYTGE
jgi:hypothetical protein